MERFDYSKRCGLACQPADLTGCKRHFIGQPGCLNGPIGKTFFEGRETQLENHLIHRALPHRSSLFCAGCEEGFVLDEPTQQCQACPATRPTCTTVNGAVQCTTCSNETSLRDSTCQDDTCAVFGPTSCHECPEGTVFSQGHCQPCPSHCLNCSLDVCFSCQAPFQLFDGTCHSLEHCLQTADYGVCSVCADGYTLNASSFACEPCTDHCLFCNTTACHF